MKIKSNTKDQLRTQIVNSIATRIAYSEKLKIKRSFRNKSDFIVLSIPIIIYASYQIPRFFENLTNIIWLFDLISLLLGICVAIFGIYKAIFQPDSDLEILSQGIASNIQETHESRFVLNSGNEEIAQWFLKMTTNLETQDTRALLDLSTEEKRYGYRQALIEFNEGDCPYCFCNPIKFYNSEKNKCEKCGNSPLEGYNYVSER